jgi:predicted O-methyltransferase YrrM
MGEQVNQNIAMLRSTFGSGRLFAPAEGDVFELDGVEFVCDYAPGSTADRFFIVKHAEHVRQYRELCGRFRFGNIVELGIAEGGGTVLAALVAEPTRLVAIDVETTPLAALAEFIAARGLEDVVRPHYGLDQADRVGLAAAIDTELGAAPIDLVIDDASHQLAATRSSFETLFPRLRAGGVFAIENWNNDHVWRDAIRVELRAAPPEEKARFFASSDDHPPEAQTVQRPLSDLLVELLLVRASSGDAIASIAVSEYWVLVERGPAELDRDSFRVADQFHDYFGYLR